MPRFLGDKKKPGPRHLRPSHRSSRSREPIGKLELRFLIFVVCSAFWVVIQNYLFTRDSSSYFRDEGDAPKGVLPTVRSPSQTHPAVHEDRQVPATEPEKDYTQPKFWRYDEAAPRIQHSRVHFLPSVPDDFRLKLDIPKGSNMSVFDALDQYASNANNTYPQKHHLAEFNPSIAKLPSSYLTNKEWIAAFGGDESHNLPVYIATFRVSNQNNCFVGENATLAIQFNNDYVKWRFEKPKMEFIGFALLNNDLEMIADITGQFRFGSIFNRAFEDYRIFNLRGGDGENEQLYLSTYTNIVPIQLTLSGPNETQESNESTSGPDGYTMLLPPITFPTTSNQQHPKFRVWFRDYTSCVDPTRVADKNKNLLYFDEIDGTETGTTKTKVLFTPASIPTEVFLAEVNKRCIRGNVSRPAYIEELSSNPPPRANASFKTMEEELFPNLSWKPDYELTHDRGSACCIRVPKDQIPIAPSIARHSKSNVTSHNDDNTLMIALVHLKTRKDRPKGVQKNTYLSRFIAFLPHEPYTVVARSGIFCLGFHTGDVNELVNPLFHDVFIQEKALKLGSETLASCPRIHFVMSMIEKNPIKNKKGHEQDGAVIMSYGVNDCYSRFVEVKKSDIINMFKGIEHSQHNAT